MPASACRKLVPDISPYPASPEKRKKLAGYMRGAQDEGFVVSIETPYPMAYAPEKRIRPVSISPKTSEADGEKFRRLTAEWQKSNAIHSSMFEVAMHPSYQQMIGMGEKALPFIFKELKAEGDEPNDWFWALAAITTENPVPKEIQGRVAEMAEAWLQWGRQNGYAGLD